MPNDIDMGATVNRFYGYRRSFDRSLFTSLGLAKTPLRCGFSAMLSDAESSKRSIQGAVCQCLGTVLSIRACSLVVILKPPWAGKSGRCGKPRDHKAVGWATVLSITTDRTCGTLEFQ